MYRERPSCQLVEQRLRLLQIERVEAFGEPAVDWSEKSEGFSLLALIAPEPRRAHRRRAIWIYSARNALILFAPCPICAIPLR